MNKRVLIIGGYGNFGRFISCELAKQKNIQVIIAGRSIEKAIELSNELDAVNDVEASALNIHADLDKAFQAINPDIVIHTSGPFQQQGYKVAKACIHAKAHYIDLADGREFVEGITELDMFAKEQGVLVISGASSVPCLTSALVDYHKPEFKELDCLNYGITTAQKTAKGLATTAAILGYTGKPFKTLIAGRKSKIFGWQGLHLRKFRELGWKLLSYCDVPDLALFPKRYPQLQNIRFYAGLEIPLIHFVLWVISWLVRFGLIKNLQRTARMLLKLSSLFDWLGSDNSAFYMELSGTGKKPGKGKKGQNKSIIFELTARSGDGPYIPSMPAILMAKKLANEQVKERGAFPCVGFITRDEYLNALSNMDISWNILKKIS